MSPPRLPRDADPADPNDPGWWLASDGRWYAPELAWYQPGTTTAPKRDAPVGLVIVLTVAAAVIIGGGIAWAVHDGSHSKPVGASGSATPTSIPPLTPTSTLTPSPVSTPTKIPTKPPLAAVVSSQASVAIGPSPGDNGPIGVAEATQVATALWADHVRARSTTDAPLLKATEAGPALEADYGYICYLGCRGPDATESQLFVNVPQQRAWPVEFEATVEYLNGCFPNDRPCVDTFVATQLERNSPWKIVFWTTAAKANSSPENRPELVPGSTYGAAPGPLSFSAHALLVEYARYLDTLKRTGRPPSSTFLAPGGFTTALASELYDPPQRQRANGYSERVVYSVDPADATWVYATSAGTTMVCGTVRYVASDVGVDGLPLVQPPNFDDFGSDVLPGQYNTVVMHGLHMVCFGLHPGYPLAFVIASYGDDATVETTPAR